MSIAFRKTILAVAVVAFTAVAVAQTSSPADTIKVRRQHLKDMGAALKTVRDQLKGKADVAAIKSAAAEIKKYSVDMKNWFPKGTGPEAGKTNARDAIWADAEGFSAAMKKFEEEASKFSQVADAGDIDGVRAGLRTIGTTCGGCHDKYKEKEED